MSKPDDRSDNAAKIKKHIDDTKHNMELANDMLERTSDPKTREALKEKNERRAKAIPEMEKEMKEEEAYKQL